MWGEVGLLLMMQAAEFWSSCRLGVLELRNSSLLQPHEAGQGQTLEGKAWPHGLWQQIGLHTLFSSLLEGRFQVRDPLRSTFRRMIRQLIFVKRHCSRCVVMLSMSGTSDILAAAVCERSALPGSRDVPVGCPSPGVAAQCRETPSGPKLVGEPLLLRGSSPSSSQEERAGTAPDPAE